jgi:hypothetical protein
MVISLCTETQRNKQVEELFKQFKIFVKLAHSVLESEYILIGVRHRNAKVMKI